MNTSNAEFRLSVGGRMSLSEEKMPWTRVEELKVQ